MSTPISNSKIEINTKEAPISKIIIYSDCLDIVTGLNNQKVIKRFKFSNDKFLNKYISFPVYLNSILQSEDDEVDYTLSGMHINNGGFIPSNEEYDSFGKDDYFIQLGSELLGPKELEFIECINFNHVMIFYSYTKNFHKEYILQILKFDPDPNQIFSVFDDEDSDNEVPEVFKNFTLKNPKQKLNITFCKDDVIYYGKNVINYGQISSDSKFNKLLLDTIKNTGNESLTYINKPLGFLVTKRK